MGSSEFILNLIYMPWMMIGAAAHPSLHPQKKSLLFRRPARCPSDPARPQGQPISPSSGLRGAAVRSPGGLIGCASSPNTLRGKICYLPQDHRTGRGSTRVDEGGLLMRRLEIE